MRPEAQVANRSESMAEDLACSEVAVIGNWLSSNSPTARQSQLGNTAAVDFIEALAGSLKNAGTGTLDSGWRIQHVGKYAVRYRHCQY